MSELSFGFCFFVLLNALAWQLLCMSMSCLSKECQRNTFKKALLLWVAVHSIQCSILILTQDDLMIEV